MPNHIHTVPRNGVSLIEVTFAIGVILIGLVGLTSILPLAGRRAQDSLDFDTSARISNSIANEVLARDLIRDTALNGPSLRTGTTIQPFCVDPFFVNSAAVPSFEQYDSSVFPFYSLNHDPLFDPSSSYTATPGFAGQPRMQRVGLQMLADLKTAGTITDAQQFEIARTLTESPDDLPQLRPKDRTVPSFLTTLTATSSNAFLFGKRIPTGAYSWLITVDPDVNSQYASMAVVVFESRERVTQFPSAVAESPRDNATAERISIAVNGVGFSGGAGGSVQLLSSGATLSDLSSGDWVMLSRTTAPSGTPTERTASQVHRWYRVVSTDGDAVLYTPTNNQTVNGISIPDADTSEDRAADTTVWSRNVILDGPDWQFATGVPTAASDNSLTYATLVENVVAVKETTISLTGF
ncbi:type IV pilus modification PilV family protein [Rhodopirellula sallentina]|uniref:Signal peptide protein n=1 Tax=Rhodopirellula sallentina SM41 TaxID=1263870 RepID=M5U262_9BACT|nr:hypothetical protein [Rhodopirellula sallentina]EMI55525.1 signal peptide protein [Rhodopirellula sallentina SM41]